MSLAISFAGIMIKMTALVVKTIQLRPALAAGAGDIGVGYYCDIVMNAETSWTGSRLDRHEVLQKMARQPAGTTGGLTLRGI